uniref:Uncharacterized protein n=1 Tax=Arundo donax TaxID=35708 RepID=A0A0A9CLI6_ARUDO
MGHGRILIVDFGLFSTPELSSKPSGSRWPTPLCLPRSTEGTAIMILSLA